ncbi:hypothetical protein A3F00_05590 [Candidatus Daviesbacteria bacterium RIFCSPHIGHO2_12_FULL_37_11]|uniref:Uncharacterized protein n=1 Tax=Candidatus Daviesbacteria bacterium RIFCSPHIGHO2_12_FULL_37_11 TaxID=1797777 RepID=A0A1F5K8Q3_9BACT|nr:MAG: hypothetical protein A3F00_05590 [Candidatus Daviesbacteria bacterium RIFCSPHIGHO2_12_FULL_37_11]OGE45325.1 MAG: hypothetical protein A3B39_01265 [Candidatus Daviesbacteria bacterium RIFCSPLOWO2_01_FULL_37_10]
MDQQIAPPAPITTQARVSKFPKLNKKSIIIILGLSILILLIPLILLSYSKKQAPEPEPPQAKTWEIILNYDNKINALAFKKLSILNQEITADFRSATYSPYELVVSDKEDRALFRTKVNITEQILYNILNEPVSSASALNSLPASLETTLYIPFKSTATKIVINKDYSPILQINIPPEVAFNFIPEVLAQTSPQNCGGMQVVFISDGYTDFNKFHNDINEITAAFSSTQPYAGKNIFDYKIIDNSQPLGCTTSMAYCMTNSSNLIKQIGFQRFPSASKFIVLVQNVGQQRDGNLGITNSVGGDIAIFARRTDIPAEEFTKTAIHEFLGHAVGLLYDRYVSADPSYGRLVGNIRSNCTDNRAGESFWSNSGSQGVFQGCGNQSYFGSSPLSCPSRNPFLSSAGNPTTIMSAAGCSVIGFDGVEQAWINQRVIPLYQTSCAQPANTPIPTTPLIPTSPANTTNNPSGSCTLGSISCRPVENETSPVGRYGINVHCVGRQDLCTNGCDYWCQSPSIPTAAPGSTTTGAGANTSSVTNTPTPTPLSGNNSTPTTPPSPDTAKTYTCEEVPSSGSAGSQVQIKTLNCH